MQPLLAALQVASPTKGKPECRTVGPYPDRHRFRVKFIEGSRKWSEIFDTRSAALAAQRAFEKRHAVKEAITVGHLVAQFLESQRRRGILPHTVEHQGWRYQVFFGYTGLLSLPVHQITAELAREAYEANARRPKSRGGEGLIAVSTHQGDLGHAKRLFEWAVEEKIATANPFANVKPLGRANRGKHQLSLDQATRWFEIARQLVERQGDVTALAAGIVCGTGARNSEVMYRRVRDLDEGCTKLRVHQGKTPKSNRPLGIPTAFVPFVAALAAGRPRDALLFIPDADVGKPEPARHTLRLRLLRKVKQICRLADVDEVVPHSFRGLFATLGVCKTGDPDLIAGLLGHASRNITERNYIDTRVAAVAQQERVQARLGMASPEPMLAQLPESERPEHLLDLAERMNAGELTEVVQQLLQVIAKKASSGRSTRKTDRSKSNAEQVCGPVRKLSANLFSRTLSDGE